MLRNGNKIPHQISHEPPFHSFSLPGDFDSLRKILSYVFHHSTLVNLPHFIILYAVLIYQKLLVL